MSFEQRLSPSRVTQAAAAAFPRPLLFALLALYIVLGLFGRDPWSSEDASAFGAALSMAQGDTGAWWLPMVAGEPLPEEGPLAFWVAALMIRLFGGWLGAVDAARLATVLWFALGTWALWYATYRLARRDEAQPVALAFGGEATRRDYGRMVADVAILLLLATFGVIARLHEITAESALLPIACIVLFALAYGLDDPWKGAAVGGLALGAAALTRGLMPAACLLLASLAFILTTGERRLARAALVVALAIGTFALWPLAAHWTHPREATAWFDAWWRWNAATVALPSTEHAVWFARNSAWYTWPLWPFALWTLFAWRHFVMRPHIALPLLMLAAGLIAYLLTPGPSEREFLLTIPAYVVLAAFGVSSLKRAAEDAIDWFSMALFTLALIALWLYAFAWLTGGPPRMAASVARLAPGFEPQFSTVAVLLAVAATVAWMLIVVWRVRKRPPMMWTGPFLAASGLSLVGVVAMSLAQPAIDYVRTYAPLAPVLAEQVERLGGDGCVQPVSLPVGVRAMLAYHGGIRFERLEDAGLCPVALQRDSRRSATDDAPPAGDWTLAYEVTRRARFDEAFRLWVRRP
jgi:4-amino-4-deoxy-L-arabinose transferase-like glycosyltransferase